MSRRNVRSVEFHGTHPAPLLTRTYFNELVIYFRAARAEGKREHYVLTSLIFSDKITLLVCSKKKTLHLAHLIIRHEEYSQPLINLLNKFIIWISVVC